MTAMRSPRFTFKCMSRKMTFSSSPAFCGANFFQICSMRSTSRPLGFSNSKRMYGRTRLDRFSSLTSSFSICFTRDCACFDLLACDPKRSTNRSEEHTSELQSPDHLACRLLLEKKKKNYAHSQPNDRGPNDLPHEGLSRLCIKRHKERQLYI